MVPQAARPPRFELRHESQDSVWYDSLHEALRDLNLRLPASDPQQGVPLFEGHWLLEVIGAQKEIVANNPQAFLALIRERLLGWVPAYELWADDERLGEFDALSDALGHIRGLRTFSGVDPLRTLRIVERRADATTVIAAGGRALRALLRASR